MSGGPAVIMVAACCCAALLSATIAHLLSPSTARRIAGLAAIVRDHPRYAASHQLAVIDCMEDPDET